MSLQRPEPGEYGWRSHEHDERSLPKQPHERYGPPTYPGVTTGDRAAAVEADRAACRDENARLDQQEPFE